MPMSVPGNSCRPCNSAVTSGCLFRLPGECVYYSGSSISGPGINTGDDFNTVVNKLYQYAGSASFTAENALNLTAGVLKWGGTLTGATTITGDANAEIIVFQGSSTGDFFTINNSNVAGKALHSEGDVRLLGPTIYVGNRTIGGNNENFFLTGTLRSYVENSVSSNPTKVSNFIAAQDLYLNNAANLTRINNIFSNNAVNLRGAATINASINEVSSNNIKTLFVRSADFTATPIVTGPTSPLIPITTISARMGSTSSGAVTLNGWYSSIYTVAELTSAAHTIENYADIIVGGRAQAVTSLISNRYGLYLNPISTAVVTNAYGIYQAGASDINFIAGNTMQGSSFSVPTAKLHLGAGTASANTAPLKFTSGSLLSSAEAGAVEFNGSHFYGTIGSTRYQLDQQVAPPGIYFSPAQAFDSSFVVFASAIIRPSNSFSHGSPIVWSILDHTTAHNSSFYTSAEPDASAGVKVNFPLVKNVLNTTITDDETFAGNGVSVGSTTGLDNFVARAYKSTPNCIKLTGNSTATWLESGLTKDNFDISAFATGVGITAFNVSAFPAEDALAIVYNGLNNYHCRRLYSGLGSYNFAFQILDDTNTPIAGNPTSDDEIIIMNAGPGVNQVLLNTWSNNNNEFMGITTNFWIFGAYECWLVASSIDTTSVLVRWQPVYPSATNYKIYRDTDPNFGTQVLIHTGTEGSYLDTGLTSDTLYYYKLVGVISGIDTTITTFRTNTKAF